MRELNTMQDLIQDPEDFVTRFKIILIVGTLLLVSPLLVSILYVNAKVNSLEESLQYKEPIVTELTTSVERPVFQGSHLTRGQIVYVPVYSHVYHQEGSPHLLTVTLSVRNTSTDKSMMLRSVDYYDTNGKKVKAYLPSLLELSPLSTKEFLVKRTDASGGSGASFLVEWTAKEPISAPIVEGVMIDTTRQQGISFVTPGRVIASQE